MQSDSVDKIVQRYFAAVTRETFTYKKKTYEPQVLKVFPMLLRGYTCPPGCGGCCLKFTLDYLPSEAKPPGAAKRSIEFGERLVEIWTDGQESNTDRSCQHLERETGRCGIYEVRPFTCDFELIRTLQSVDDAELRQSKLTQKLFGRGWSYERVDGGKGALCEMTPPTPETIKDVVRKLRRLKKWSDHFGLDTWIPDILSLIEHGSLTQRIIFYPPTKAKTSFGL